MTDSPSDTSAPAAPSAAAAVAERFGAMVGAVATSGDFATARIRVTPDQWVDTHRTLSTHLPFFSFLSAIDWASEVAVGDPPEGEVAERYEVFTRLADVGKGEGVIISTDISKDDPRLPTLIEVFGGANWHEREAHEMFGIVFEGHPKLDNLYLPDGFEGHPLRKTFPLLSREVKPWPGTVDVEAMPGTENVEADALASDGEAE
ncbi:MAG: NADH-quinone oxidoreductase subunit C [Acidimicrobiia bacterium]